MYKNHSSFYNSGYDSREDEFEQCPLNDTDFLEVRPAVRSSGPYSIVPPMHDNQPLLHPISTIPQPTLSSEMHLSSSMEKNNEPMYYMTRAPKRQPRRYKTTRHVKLTRGNLVLECPVPTQYIKSVPIKDGKEFTHMRYTAATCDPRDFVTEGYTLRQQLLGRQTELFIVLTMYNVKRDHTC
ncbi:Chitin synthase, class 1 [Rhizopus stolonifer]|uniref:Chitin synthase, class 1 n=1 Tax=Rhizopus stolonifer TaxID=4846 RepID=A0A367KJ85_RHIST|nr:Chitin synthase, class 1 [Rhizopus stolonifer]